MCKEEYKEAIKAHRDEIEFRQKLVAIFIAELLHTYDSYHPINNKEKFRLALSVVYDASFFNAIVDYVKAADASEILAAYRQELIKEV